MTVEHLRPREIRSVPEQVRPHLDQSSPSRWLVEDSVDVTIDGEGLWDAEEDAPVPAVVLRMPPYVARHLACLLDDWSTIGRLLESARGGDERDLAGVLYEAARVAETLRADAS